MFYTHSCGIDLQPMDFAHMNHLQQRVCMRFFALKFCIPYLFAYLDQYIHTTQLIDSQNSIVDIV
jgi:hypothetical protein